jgi:hypothetical protein
MMKHLTSILFVGSLLAATAAAEEPLDQGQVMVGLDGGGILNPAPPAPAVIGADGHGQFLPPTAEVIVGADGHGQFLPPPAEVTDTQLVDVKLVSPTSELLGADGHGVFVPPSEQEELLDGSGDVPAIVDHWGDHWTLTHFNNDTVCFDDGRDTTVGTTTGCWSSRSFHMLTGFLTISFWSTVLLVVWMACRLRGATRRNRELTNRIAAMLEGRIASEFGAFVQSDPLALDDDGIMLVPPSYIDTANKEGIKRSSTMA